MGQDPICPELSPARPCSPNTPYAVTRPCVVLSKYQLKHPYCRFPALALGKNLMGVCENKVPFLNV